MIYPVQRPWLLPATILLSVAVLLTANPMTWLGVLTGVLIRQCLLDYRLTLRPRTSHNPTTAP